MDQASDVCRSVRTCSVLGSPRTLSMLPDFKGVHLPIPAWLMVMHTGDEALDVSLLQSQLSHSTRYIASVRYVFA